MMFQDCVRVWVYVCLMCLGGSVEMMPIVDKKTNKLYLQKQTYDSSSLCGEIKNIYIFK